MRLSEIVVGETYLLPVVATEVSDFGNMIRLVTGDEGKIIWAHPEALHVMKTLDVLYVKKGERYGSQ